MTTQKQCKQCKEHLDIDCFCKDRQRKDGLHPYCRECKRESYLKRTPHRKRIASPCGKTNHETRLSELEEKIRDLVPRLKRKEVQMVGDGNFYCPCGRITKVYDDPEEEWCPSFYYEREITLEDVLEAWDKVIVKKGVNLKLIEYQIRKSEICGMWEYGKPLSEQSEELITFLHSILCQNK